MAKAAKTPARTAFAKKEKAAARARARRQAGAPAAEESTETKGAAVPSVIRAAREADASSAA